MMQSFTNKKKNLILGWLDFFFLVEVRVFIVVVLKFLAIRSFPSGIFKLFYFTFSKATFSFISYHFTTLPTSLTLYFLLLYLNIHFYSFFTISLSPPNNRQTTITTHWTHCHPHPTPPLDHQTKSKTTFKKKKKNHQTKPKPPTYTNKPKKKKKKLLIEPSSEPTIEPHTQLHADFPQPP